MSSSENYMKSLFFVIDYKTWKNREEYKLGSYNLYFKILEKILHVVKKIFTLKVINMYLTVWFSEYVADASSSPHSLLESGDDAHEQSFAAGLQMNWPLVLRQHTRWTYNVCMYYIQVCTMFA